MQFVEIDVTPAVRSWLTGEANTGFLVTAATASVVFDSKENTATSQPPRLELTWVFPGSSPGPEGLVGPQGPAGLQGPAGVSLAVPGGSNFSMARIAQRRWGEGRRPLIHFELPGTGGELQQGPLRFHKIPVSLETDGDFLYVVTLGGYRRVRGSDLFVTDVLDSDMPVFDLQEKLKPGHSVALADGAHVWRAGNNELSTGMPEGPRVPSTWGTTRRIVSDGVDFWIAGDSRLVKVSAKGEVLVSLNNVTASHLASDGVHIWALTNETGELQRRNGVSGQLMSSYSACTPGLTINSLVFDGTSIWASCTAGSSIYQVDVSDFNKPASQSHSLSFHPGVIDFDGRFLWAANESSPGSVVRLSTKQSQNLAASNWRAIRERKRRLFHSASTASTCGRLLAFPLTVSFL
jgi:hypothetical protein